jgi:hypothetical protein
MDSQELELVNPESSKLVVKPDDWHERVERARTWIRKSIVARWHLGRELLRQRKAFGHGLWGHYLDELGISDTTADTHMDLATKFPDAGNLEGVESMKQAFALAEALGIEATKRTPRRRASRDKQASGDPHRSGAMASTSETREQVTRSLPVSGDQLASPRVVEGEYRATGVISSVAETVGVESEGDDLEDFDAPRIRGAAPQPGDTASRVDTRAGVGAILDEVFGYSTMDWAPLALDHVARELGLEWLANDLVRRAQELNQTDELRRMLHQRLRVINIPMDHPPIQNEPAWEAERLVGSLTQEVGAMVDRLKLKARIDDKRKQGGAFWVRGEEADLQLLVEALPDHGWEWNKLRDAVYIRAVRGAQ